MIGRLMSTLMRFAVVFALANIARLVVAAPFQLQPMASESDGSIVVEPWADNGGNAIPDTVTLTDGWMGISGMCG